jgi:hypothetical protein
MEMKIQMKSLSKFEAFIMKKQQNQDSLIIVANVKKRHHIKNILCNINRAIMQVTKDRAKTNVHIDDLKWVMKEDGIQVVLVFWKLFLKHVVPKSNF